MSVVAMNDPATGRFAIFAEAPGGGSPADPNSLRNSPLNSPADWLALIDFHTDLDNLEVVSDTPVSVNHVAIAAGTSAGLSGGAGGGSSGGGNDNAVVVRYGASSADTLLVTHNLGYVPDCLAVVGTNVLFPGMPVQTQADGRGRYVTLYATTTQIRLYEWASASGAILPASTIKYRVLVFREPRPPAGNVLLDWNPATGVVKLGRDRFSSDRRYLQVVPGGSPFGIAYGRTIDLNNGAPRNVNPDGTMFEPVPNTAKSRWRIQTSEGTMTGAYGAAMNYGGSFVGPAQILVQAP